MRDIFSKFVHCLSWLAAVLTAFATAWWISIVADGNDCWAAFAFGFGMALPFCIGTLVLGVIPSGGFYLQKKQRKDLMSLWLAGCSFGIVLVEAILLNLVIPQRGE